MKYLSFNQKMIVGGLGVLIIIIAIYYIYAKNTQVDYSLVDQEYQNEIKILEESKDSDKELVIHITGQVEDPGIVKVPTDSRIVDVIDAAGGLTESADLTMINLAYMVSDGQKIYIPSIEDHFNGAYITSDNGNGIIVDITSDNTGSSSLININTATQTSLETLTGIGPSTALKIIDYRKNSGKFSSIEDLKNVPGIGDAKFNAIKDKICI